MGLRIFKEEKTSSQIPSSLLEILHTWIQPISSTPRSKKRQSFNFFFELFFFWLVELLASLNVGKTYIYIYIYIYIYKKQCQWSCLSNYRSMYATVNYTKSTWNGSQKENICPIFVKRATFGINKKKIKKKFFFFLKKSCFTVQTLCTKYTKLFLPIFV